MGPLKSFGGPGEVSPVLSVGLERGQQEGRREGEGKVIKEEGGGDAQDCFAVASERWEGERGRCNVISCYRNIEISVSYTWSLLLPKQAEANPEVQRQIQSHIPLLQDFVLKILEKLQSTIEEVPFGIRWLCKATRSLVQEKFSEISADQVNAFIGGFFFLRYINPLIATPHGRWTPPIVHV